MAKQPINNGKVVERSYEDYRNNQYLVNRRYLSSSFMCMMKSNVCFPDGKKQLLHKWYHQGPIEDRVIFKYSFFPCMNY